MLEAIYHPTYVPEKEWFKLQLLLWDKIYRIVPYSVEKDFGPARIADLWDIDESYLPIIDNTIPSRKFLEERKATIISQLKEISKKNSESFVNAKHFYLNTEKVPDWVGEYLKEFGLRSQETYDEWGAEHYLVREDASNFIMSCLAHYLGIAKGMSPLTNHELSCFATFGNQIGRYGEDKPSGENFNSFITGVFDIMVPANIEELEFSEVLDIRNEYKDLRKGARNVLEDIAEEFKLNEIVDGKSAEEAIKNSLEEFKSQVESFNKSNWRRAFKDWKVQTIATVLGTLAGFIAGGPVAALAVSGTSGGISIMNQIAGKEEPSDIGKLTQYYSRINKTIEMKNFNEDLLKYRKAILENYL